MPAVIAAVSYIVGVDAQRRTFHRCRALYPIGQVFTINDCSANESMRIDKALIGYSDKARLEANPPWCNFRNCTMSFYDVVFRLCNGHPSCRIDQNLLITPGPNPPNSALCALQRDANYIDVKFFCVSGIIYLMSHVLIYADHDRCLLHEFCLSL